jgi:hypothetical protein
MTDDIKKPADDETEALTIEDLNIDELERRLELAATDAACACWKYM